MGLLYQQFMGTRWVTTLELTKDAWATQAEVHILHSAPSDVPARTFLPYLGDYVRLITVGDSFFGVFCGNNTPDPGNFPSGIAYQRNTNWSTHVLLNTDNVTPVAPSIDPFFFQYDPDSGAAWHWADQGTPSGVSVSGPVGVLTVMDTPASAQRPYAFVRGSDGHLWVNWWDGSTWHWADQGTPSGVSVSGPVGVLTVMDTPASAQRPYAFVQSSDGYLWVNWWG
jgi:hypothetical protein